jgi:hypothetical protein
MRVAAPPIGLLGRMASTSGRVHELPLPPAARALSTLPHVDYADAFVVETRPAQDRTGEQWAHAILGGAPIIVRRALVAGWCALGLQLGRTRSDRFVLGWEVHRSSPDFALLAARSPIGLSAELLFMRRPHAVLFATLLHEESHIARAVWAGVEPVHRQVVRSVLEQAARREWHGADREPIG